jgi:DNA repair ATPase RecN
MSEIDIVDRLRFDAVRCEAQFSKGVASNIEEAANEIERLRAGYKHNEQAIHACNQKISELELWNREYREQIAFWKAKAGAPGPDRNIKAPQ